MTSPTGNREVVRLPDGWTLEIEISWVEVPPEREAHYWATIEWYAQEISKSLTAPEARKTVSI